MLLYTFNETQAPCTASGNLATNGKRWEQDPVKRSSSSSSSYHCVTFLAQIVLPLAA